MVTLHFLDTDEYQFSTTIRLAVEAAADAADALVRQRIEPSTRLHVLVEASADVLETGDNAVTMAPHLIRWWFNPAVDVAALAERRFFHAYAHEAFHATRFRKLPDEASARSWLHIAINEGLATAFARDIAHAAEPWANYDPETVEAWSRELLALDPTTSSLADWKFQHPDGRQWIAFRVGTWIVDAIRTTTGKTAADLVWTPAVTIAQLQPDLRGTSSG